MTHRHTNSLHLFPRLVTPQAVPKTSSGYVVFVDVPLQSLQTPVIKEQMAFWDWSAYWPAPPPGEHSGMTSLCLMRKMEGKIVKEVINVGFKQEVRLLIMRLRLWHTSELSEDFYLLVQDLLQLSSVRFHIIIHLFRHLQQHLLILQPPDWLLLTEQVLINRGYVMAPTVSLRQVLFHIYG